MEATWARPAASARSVGRRALILLPALVAGVRGSARPDRGRGPAGEGGGTGVPPRLLRVPAWRSPLDTVAACRERCWKKDWVIDLDVEGFSGSVRRDLIVKAVKAHTDLPWVVLYVKRWLAAPLALPDGTLLGRDRGIPYAEPGKLAVDSPVTPRLVLLRQPQHDRPHLAVRRRASRAAPGR